MRRALAAILAAASLAGGQAAARVADLDAIHPVGLQLPTPEIRAFAARQARVITAPADLRRARSLPSAVKNHRYLPVVRTQQLANCGAFSPTYYYKTWQEAKEHGWERPDPEVNPERIMSPGFTYPLSNMGVNAGAFLDLVFGAFVMHGCGTWADMPENYDFTSYPTQEVWRRAIPFRARSYGAIDLTAPGGIDALREHLAGGDLATIGLAVHTQGFDLYPAGLGQDNQVLFANGTGEFRGFHAVTIIGYDDLRAYDDGSGEKRGAVLAVNSWGPGFGVVDPDVGTGGFMWIAYEYLRTVSGKFFPAYVMEDRIGYQPNLYAVFGLDHPRRWDLMVSLEAGDPASPDWRYDRIFPTGGGPRPFAGNVVLDISELTTYDGFFNLTLTVLDWKYEPRTTGLVTYFAVEDVDGRRRISTEPPLPTLDFPSGPATARLRAQFGPTGVRFGDLDLGEGATLAWGDLDGDGDPDLAASGWDRSRAYAFTRVFRNDGRGSFTDLRAGLPGTIGAVSWVDLDRDGRLDLALCGWDPINDRRLTRLYRNAGDGALREFPADLPGLDSCAMAWGDYDNDGLADVALGGYDLTLGAVTRLYRHNGGGSFSDSRVALPGMRDGSLAWGDFDDDGLLDLVVTRADDPGSQLLRNTGRGTFTVLADLGPTSANSSLAPADVDGDGDLDLALMGEEGLDARATRIFRNDGGGVFTQVATSLPGLSHGSLAWGDLDNDGLPDLALMGNLRLNPDRRLAEVYRNAGPEGFQPLSADMPHLAGGRFFHGTGLAWADHDGDGDLDLALSGDGEPPYPLATVTQLWESEPPAGPNAPPAAPHALDAGHGPSFGEVLLTWAAPADDRTPSTGLLYALRVGTGPGADDVVSGAVGSPLVGEVLHAALAPGVPGRLLRHLPDGTYWWSVRAFDAGLAASPWSAEGSFTLTGGSLASGRRRP